jgi:hypothetical protein
MRYPRPAALATVLALTVAACSSDIVPPPPTPAAQLRVVNTTAGVTAVDLLVDGDVAVAGVGFLGTSDYVPVLPGAHQVALRAVPSGVALGSASVTLTEDLSYTVFATVATDTTPPIVAADTGVVPAAGKVKLRVVHAAPSAPPLDVFLTLNDESLAGATPLLQPFTYGVGTSPDFPGYVERDPGEYRVRFTDQGTTNVVIDTGPIPVAAGQVRSVILFQSDSLGGTMGIQIIDER